jgi:peptidoglycan/LPS O-acetylase OafA/YrhL
MNENEMAQIALESTEKSQETAAGVTSRVFFADHLRAALIILVVLHHVAIVYGASSPFWYFDPPKSPETLGGLVLGVFVLFNQAWFMGALFLLAGYFTPGSFERKGSSSFLKDRLIRLGIPLVIFYLVLSPLSAIGLWLEPASQIPGPLTLQSYFQTYPYLVDLGVAWFLALLLIFSFGYVAWRELTKNREPSSTSEYSPPTYLGVGLFILGLALVSYLFRIIIPMGRTVLQFPTLAYLPQYLSFFIVGTVAYRRDWFRTVTGRMGGVGFVTAILASLILFPLAFLSVFRGEILFIGMGTWRSAVYALWDTTFAVGMCLASITFFRRFFNTKSQLGSFLAQQSYAVYLIHIPIIIFLAYVLRGIDIGGVDFGPLLKFVLLSVIVVPICFVVAWVLRKIPGVSRVI